MEQLHGPSGPGSVVLDIGGDVGAAIVYAPASLNGAEVEIRRHDAPWDGTHVEVRARQLPTGATYAALFGRLAQGSYEVRVRHGETDGPLVAFDVSGGKVSTARLSL
jgi:hypothetical protein